MINQLVVKYRKQQNLTLDQFASALCDDIPGKKISRQAVHYWEKGEYQPNYTFMVSVFMTYKDWRYDFAHECLQVLRPEVWVGDSTIE